MHELIDRLAATPKTLAHLVAQADDARLDAPRDGGWNARTTLAHLRDDEYLCMRCALERILAEPDPEVRFIDGADWEPGRNRTRDRKEQILGDFALQRQATIAILRALREEDWQRGGSAAGWGSFTIAELVAAWAHHDSEHIAQLEAAIGESLADVLQRRARPLE